VHTYFGENVIGIFKISKDLTYFFEEVSQLKIPFSSYSISMVTLIISRKGFLNFIAN
jgi:hypothetical protein